MFDFVTGGAPVSEGAAEADGGEVNVSELFRLPHFAKGGGVGD